MVFFLVLLMLIPVKTRASEVLTLEEAFQMALRQSETVAIREESIRTAEAHYLQALGTALPHLNVLATETIQDTSGTGGADGSVGNTFTRRSRPEVAVSLRQPLFQGLREFCALKISSAEKKKNTLERDRVKQLLFFDMTRAYYTVLELEDEEAILGFIRETLARRMENLKDRLRLGKSRESELLTAESQQAALDAEIEKVRGLVQTSRDLLGFLTGKTVVNEKLADAFQIPSRLESLEGHLAALRSRPDLQASQEAVRLAQGNFSYEKGARLPFLDFEANYYPYRAGFLEDIDWDVTFSLNLPLFSGGATRGRIREARSKLKQSELARQETSRRAETETRQAYHALQSSYSRLKALRRAETKSAANYRAQSGEYGLGLVNNLEVLQSLREWQERRLDANRAHYQTKLDYLQLKVTTGDLPQ